MSPLHSVDLTEDCGASVHRFRKYYVRLSLGGDLSVSIVFAAEAAKAFAQALIKAADEAEASDHD